jgi:hypothetical protein
MVFDSRRGHAYSGVFIRNWMDGTVWNQAQLGRKGGYLLGNSPTNAVMKRFKNA